jgi:hypothetical protein
MPILCVAALLVGIMIADLQIKSPKKGKKESDKKPESGGDKPKGEDSKKPDSGDDKPKGEDGKKPFSLSDVQGELTLYVSTKKSKD